MGEPSVKRATGRKHYIPDPQSAPKWVAVAAAVFGGITLLFFIGLTLASLFNFEVPAESRFLVLVVLSFGAATSAGFLGGAATARGKIPLPGTLKNTFAVSTAGGVAVLLILLLVGYYLYVEPAAHARSQVVLTLPPGAPRDFTIENLSPEKIVDVGEVRSVGNRQFLYVEFLPGKSSGDVRLTYLKNSGPGFESVVYEVKSDGRLVERPQN
jgi:hypothetical protein